MRSRSLSQFHYGSIKTFKKWKIWRWKIRSQFHYGSIKTRLNACSFFFRILSQFHYGSIKTDDIELKVDTNVGVSIPLWFD